MHLTDFHAHILPGLDHGSDSLDCSMPQVYFAMKQRVPAIVATSHFYPHRHQLDGFLERRERAHRILCDEIADAYDTATDVPVIYTGAEVLLCPGIENLNRLDELCIEGTRTLLLELPFHPLGTEERRTVVRLLRKGYRVLLAHADRYDKEDIESLIAEGAILQLNADALCGVFVPIHLISWMRRGLVHALGSDIHGEDKRAYVRFVRAERRLARHCKAIHELSRELLPPIDRS